MDTTTKLQILIEHHPAQDRLDTMGVLQWPIWSKEISTFPWHYDQNEVCYLLEGDVTVTPENGVPVRFGQGDMVTFPAGLACHWEIHSPVKKHYDFL
jgi:uncharacterized cupin superfamily protein